MKNKLRIMLLALIVFINCILLSGCWNYREIEKLSIVAGFAIDKDSDTGNFKITAELVNVSGAGSGSMGGKQQSMTSAIYTSEGKTVFDAVRNFISKTGKRLYWSHAKIVIIGNEVAKEDIVQVSDWIMRDSEPRTDMWVVISKEKTAGEILNSETGLNPIKSFELDELMKNQKSVFTAIPTELWQVIQDLGSDSISVSIPSIELVMEDGVKTPEISGTAVFKKNKLIGWIDGEDTKWLAFLKNKMKATIIPIINAAGTKNDVSLEVFGNDTKIKSEIENGQIKMNVYVKTYASIDELQGTKNLTNEIGSEKVKKDGEELIKAKMKSFVKKLQTEYESDIVGFGRQFQIQKPKERKKIKDWNEEFAKIDVEVYVDMKIIGTAYSSKPIKVGK